MMTRGEILNWLHEEDPAALEELWSLADSVRRTHVGDEVHLRGLVEISNHCCRQCAYCGLRAGHQAIARYRITPREILECAEKAVDLGYGTIVMQAGEDFGIAADELAHLIREIKRETPLAVTLSLGERSDDELRLWKQAGADRYLLRFETSDQTLFNEIHPPRRSIADEMSQAAATTEKIHPQILSTRNPDASGNADEHRECNSDICVHLCSSVVPLSCSDVNPRLAQLRRMRDIGYEIGTGVMVGIPGQTYQTLADDIDVFRSMDMDMIGIGPFIPHPATPLGDSADGMSHALRTRAGSEQTPNTELMVYKMVALTRLACPQANLPATTALATINKESGRELGLQRGANIVMPNLTPLKYRAMYEIYPAKACINETADQCAGCLQKRIESIGRSIGSGPGGRNGRAAATPPWPSKEQL